MVMVRVMGMAMVTMAEEQTMAVSEAERGVAPSRGGGVASNSKV